ncbi:MAG: hypothetical protein JNL79_39990 [Myxococcales bacterium]|nr:hypothetical protein [Myxococcales bacterium]
MVSLEARVRNPSATPTRRVVTLPHLRGRWVNRVEVDGVAVKPLEGHAPEDLCVSLDLAPSAMVTVRGMSPTLLYEESTDHDLSAMVNTRGLAIPASLSRHPTLGSARYGDRVYLLWVDVGALGSFAAGARLDLDIVVTRRWQVRTPGFTTSEEPDGTHHRCTLEKGQEGGGLVEVRVVDPKATLPLLGGPLLGFSGAGEGSGRLVVGGEVAAPNWLLHSVVYETDLHRGHWIIPAIHVAPTITILSIFGIGLGMPVRVAPDLRVGARFQIDAHAGWIGFGWSLDVYPRVANSDALVEPRGWVRLSL